MEGGRERGGGGGERVRGGGDGRGVRERGWEGGGGGVICVGPGQTCKPIQDRFNCLSLFVITSLLAQKVIVKFCAVVRNNNVYSCCLCP